MNIEIFEATAKNQSFKNIQYYGIQNQKHLLTVIPMYVGELINAYYNGNIPDQYQALYNLTALMYDYYLHLAWEGYGQYDFKCKDDFEQHYLKYLENQGGNNE